MQSAQNSIYLQPDCWDFRDHPWAGCGFIVLVSLFTTLFSLKAKQDAAFTVASVYVMYLFTNTSTKMKYQASCKGLQ